MLKTFDHRLKLHATRKLQLPAKVTESFYNSTAWKKVRAEVLKRDDYLCSCGRGETKMYVDHVIERKDGGADFDMSNLRTMCSRCHVTKTYAERARRNQP